MSFVVDTFTDVDGTVLGSHIGEVGASWGNSNGASAPIINSNEIYSPGGGVTAEATGVPATADYDVQADFHVLTLPGTAASMGVIGRSDSSTNTWYQWYFDCPTGTWYLYKRVAGSYTLLGSFADAGMTAGVTKTGTLSMVGTTIVGKVAGVARVTVTDAAISAKGKAGVVGDTETTTTGVHLDNFSATDAVTVGVGPGLPPGYAQQAVPFMSNSRI